jgi:UDP-sulfoquinovose synthase
MNVLVLGGDGFCGWPTALHLSARGMKVSIVDNLSRRRIDHQLGTASLTPIASMETRLGTWHERTGRVIEFSALDLAHDYDALCELLRRSCPDAIVHFAEQRSAPYSMRSPATKRYTVQNNLAATHNLLCALVETGLDAHLVHLGTMGVYGYGGNDAPLDTGAPWSGRHCTCAARTAC